MATLKMTWPDGTVCVCEFDFDDTPDEGDFVLSGDGARRVEELLEVFWGSSAYSPWSRRHVKTRSAWIWWTEFSRRLQLMGLLKSVELIDAPTPPPPPERPRLSPSDLPEDLRARLRGR